MHDRAPERVPISFLLPLLAAAIALAVVYRTPYQASDLRMVPDEVEYAVGAQRIVTEGSYDLVIEGRSLPPRYPPWFSLMLAPVYALFGAELGNGILPVAAFAALAMVIACGLGRRGGSDWGGACAAMALLALPMVRFCGSRVITDLPATALLLVALWLYLGVRASGGIEPRGQAFPGLIVAVASALRPTSAAAVLPFVWLLLRRERGWRLGASLAALSAPLALVVLANGAYNLWVFGSVLRNGYNFWTSVPYDYPWLTFSAAYVPANLKAFLLPGGLLVVLPLLLVGLGLRRLRLGSSAAVGRESLRPFGEFLLAGIGPIVLFHLFYFFPAPRFSLPLASILAILAGRLLGESLAFLPRRLLHVLLGLGLLIAIAARLLDPLPPPARRLAAERMGAETPDDAVIVTAIDPVYLEPLVLRGTKRRAIPISRHVEYASKLLTPRRIPDPHPAPSHWRDHRARGLRAAGAEEAVTRVAAEDADWLVRLAWAGTPVWLESSHIRPHDGGALRELRRHFERRHAGGTLYELVPREASRSADAD